MHTGSWKERGRCGIIGYNIIIGPKKGSACRRNERGERSGNNIYPGTCQRVTRLEKEARWREFREHLPDASPSDAHQAHVSSLTAPEDLA